MPINRREFESGELDVSFLVMDFLRSNSDYAYTAEELVAELTSRDVDLRIEKVQSVLSSLEKHERVEAKTMGGMVY